eukprot:3205787-Amphidinium_carterae.1
MEWGCGKSTLHDELSWQSSVEPTRYLSTPFHFAAIDAEHLIASEGLCYNSDCCQSISEGAPRSAFSLHARDTFCLHENDTASVTEDASSHLWLGEQVHASLDVEIGQMQHNHVDILDGLENFYESSPLLRLVVDNNKDVEFDIARVFLRWR